MYSSFARMSDSPLIFWFTIGMLVAVPIAMLIIGIRGVRKDDPNDQRAGRAMLGLAGLVAAIALAAVVYVFFVLPSGNEAAAALIAATLI